MEHIQQFSHIEERHERKMFSPEVSSATISEKFGANNTGPASLGSFPRTQREYTLCNGHVHEKMVRRAYLDVVVIGQDRVHSRIYAAALLQGKKHSAAQNFQAKVGALTNEKVLVKDDLVSPTETTAASSAFQSRPHSPRTQVADIHLKVGSCDFGKRPALVLNHRGIHSEAMGRLLV